MTLANLETITDTQSCWVCCGVCGGCGLCGCGCGRGVCAVWRVWCGTLDKPRVSIAKRHYVYRQPRAHVETHVRVVPVHTQRRFETYTRSPPLPTHRHTKPNTTPTQTSLGYRQRKREETERERRDDEREEGRRKREKKKEKTAFFHWHQRWHVHVGDTVFCSFSHEKNAIWNTFHDVCFFKAFDFPEWFHDFFASRKLCQNTYRDFKSYTSLAQKIGLEICKSA